MQINTNNWRNNIYFLSLLIYAGLMYWGRSMITVSVITVLVAWLLGGNFSEKWNRLKRRKVLWLLFVYFLMYILGYFYSDNTSWAIQKIVIQAIVPIMILVVGTMPSFTEKQIKFIMQTNIVSLVLNTFWNLWHFYFYMDNAIDTRDISMFMSHIRLSMYVVMSVFICYYYVRYRRDLLPSKFEYYFMFGSLVWFVIFLFLLQSLSGIGIIAIISLILAIHTYRTHASKDVKVAIAVTIFFLINIFAISVYRELKYFITPIDTTVQEEFTAQGNKYAAFTDSVWTENGYYVNKYICYSELSRNWKSRSSVDLNSYDHKGQEVRKTLIRYLTSRGLRKDSVGIAQLSDADIKAIEQGVANYRFLNTFSFSRKIYETIWELYAYKNGADPTGHSLPQRIEFLRCAKNVISENFWFGVGTGDLNDSMNAHYKLIQSKLSRHNRFLPHNQYISLIAMFGIVGFVIIVLSLLGVLYLMRKQLNFLFFVSFAILLLSMFNEDTLDNQAGASFMIFFCYLFLLASDKTYLPEVPYHNSITDFFTQKP